MTEQRACDYAKLVWGAVFFTVILGGLIVFLSRAGQMPAGVKELIFAIVGVFTGAASPALMRFAQGGDRVVEDLKAEVEKMKVERAVFEARMHEMRLMNEHLVSVIAGAPAKPARIEDRT